MVAMLLGNGFEPLEAIAPCDVLRRGGVELVMAAIEDRVVEAGHGVRMVADCTISELDVEELEMVILPGGWGGVCSILESKKAMSIVEAVYNAGKPVAAICAGPLVLANLGITEGKKATCYPGLEDRMGGALMQNAAVVRDGRIVTGRAAGSATRFGLEILAMLKGDEAAKKVADSIVYAR